MFPIVQGGLDLSLREQCLKGVQGSYIILPILILMFSDVINKLTIACDIYVEIVKRDTPGYAIGGLSGGEEKSEFWKVVDVCTGYLPRNKPRYLMGVGFAEDLVVCSALGVDMFDCVYPTRTAVCFI